MADLKLGRELDFSKKRPDFPSLTGVRAAAIQTPEGGPIPESDVNLGLSREIARSLFDDGAGIGPRDDQVPADLVRMVGGSDNPEEALRNISASRRPEGFVENANAILDSLNGRVNAEQRANPTEMTGLQKTLLFIADINAIGAGRPPPSLLLAQQGAQMVSVQELAERQAVMDGVGSFGTIVEQLSSVPSEIRPQLGSALADEMSDAFGSGFGEMIRIVANNPGSADVIAEAIRNAHMYDDGTINGGAEMFASLVANGQTSEGVNLYTSMLKDGTFEREVFSKAPTSVAEKLDAMSEGLRETGDAKPLREVRSAEEFILLNRKLPENHPARLSGAEVAALQNDPALFLNVLPHIVTPEERIEERKRIREGERSAPVNFVKVDPDTEQIVDRQSAPQSSNRALSLMRDGYMRWDNVIAASMNGGTADREEIGALRDDFTKESKDFKDVLFAFTSVKASMKSISEAASIDDINQQAFIALINSVQRMIDPGVAVREGDVKLIQDAGSFLDNMMNIVESTLFGQKLTPDQVRDIGSIASNLFDMHRRNQVDVVEKRYRDIAELRRIPDAETEFGFLTVRGPEDAGTLDVPFTNVAGQDVTLGRMRKAKESIRARGGNPDDMDLVAAEMGL